MFLFVSVQKSGTDMLSQALGIYDGPYLQIDGMVDPADIHPNAYVIGELRKDWPRGISRSHMHYDDAYLDALVARGAKIVFAYRDPRDVIVSWMHWIKTRQAAGWFDLYGYRGDEQTLWDILNVSRFHFMRFLGWLSTDYIHTVRFEDLIENRMETLERLSVYLQPFENAESMSRKIDPGSSTTFRKGIIGDWVNYFDHNMTEYFWNTCGDIMEVMGYE